jgi:arsenate reductase
VDEPLVRVREPQRVRGDERGGVEGLADDQVRLSVARAHHEGERHRAAEPSKNDHYRPHRGGYPLRGATGVIQIFGTAKCKVTRAAQRFFADRRIKVQFVDLREKGLSRGELASVARAVGGMRALYDAEEGRVKERGLQYLGADDARLAELMLEDPLLLRTPIVRDGTKATVGAAEMVWKAFADAAKG